MEREIMKLYIQQKVFSWGDKFAVRDTNGNPVYYVEGEVFTFGKKLHVYDLNRTEVCYIAQEVLHWMPQYVVHISGLAPVKIVKKFTFFSQRYEIEGSDWTVDGDFFAHNYVVNNRYGQICSLRKEWLSWGDAYELDIADPQNAVMALAVVLAVDAAMENRN